MTFTDTPGIAPFDESVTTPVMLPRSDCAQHGAATESVANMETARSRRLMIIGPPRMGHPTTRFCVRRELFDPTNRISSSAMDTPFEAFLKHHDGLAWATVRRSLSPSIHEV